MKLVSHMKFIIIAALFASLFTGCGSGIEQGSKVFVSFGDVWGERAVGYAHGTVLSVDDKTAVVQIEQVGRDRLSQGPGIVPGKPAVVPLERVSIYEEGYPQYVQQTEVSQAIFEIGSQLNRRDRSDVDVDSVASHLKQLSERAEELDAPQLVFVAESLRSVVNDAMAGPEGVERFLSEMQQRLSSYQDGVIYAEVFPALGARFQNRERPINRDDPIAYHVAIFASEWTKDEFERAVRSLRSDELSREELQELVDEIPNITKAMVALMTDDSKIPFMGASPAEMQKEMDKAAATALNKAKIRLATGA